METARLRLEPPSLKFQPAMLEAILESKGELEAYLPWVPHSLTEEASIANVKEAITFFENYEKELRYSIHLKETGELVGVIGLLIRDKTLPAFEIGYWLRTSCVGFGYMTEAVHALESYAFDELNAQRIVITSAEGNSKSRAVAERAGYELEETLINERTLPSGELTNTVVYIKHR